MVLCDCRRRTVGRVRAVLIKVLTNGDKEDDDKEDDDKKDDEKEDELESQINLKKWNFTIVAKSSNSSNKVNSKQCSGIAKSTSKRCRNNTKNENGYCYLHQSQSSDYVPPAKTNYKGRCTATTKKRTQCKRNASDGTKYCWQHQ